MKSIAVLFTWGIDYSSSAPFPVDELNKSYEVFSKRAKKFGLRVYYANYDSYHMNSFLKQAWYFDKKWKTAKNVEIDFVYNRFNRAVYKGHKKEHNAEIVKYEIIKNVGMLNHPELEEFCWDKILVKEYFPEYCPKTFLVNSIKGLKTVVSEIKSKKIILKPRYGTLGLGVIVADKNHLPEKIRRNTVVQEFIDSSHGIKGLARGMHDLRIIVINGKIDHCHIRTPGKGLLVANVARGGTKRFIQNSRIPEKAVSIVREIDSVLSRFYPRIYSIDLIFDKNQNPYIVECNSAPVIRRYAFGKYKMPSFFDRILSAIKSGIKVKVEN